MSAGSDSTGVFLDHRRALRRWKLLVVLVAAVVLVVAVVQVVRSVRGSPAAAVADYFDALAARDVDAALALVAEADRAGSPAGAQDAPLLRDAVLQAPEYAPPTGVEILGETARDDITIVPVEYTVDGLQYEDTLATRRAEAFLDGRVLGRWRLVDGLRAFTLGDAPAGVEVNGRAVAVADDGGAPRTLAAFPGAYQVAAPDDDPVWRAQPVNVRVTGQTPVVDVPMVPHDDVRARVAEQVRSYVDDCAASAEVTPAGCPFGHAEFAGADDVSWRVARYPEVTITGPGPEVTSDEGEAVLTGEHPRWDEFEATVSFTVVGDVTVADGQVVFRPH